MNKTIVIPILLFVSLLSISAQEFWLQPVKFIYKSGERQAINFLNGENFMGEAWDLKKNQIEALSLHQLSKSISVIDSASEGKKENVKLTLNTEGTYLLTMQTKNVLNEWDGAKFNDLLKEYGLDEILESRKKINPPPPSKEHYATYTKLLFQVGEKKDDTYKKSNNFPVEILPLENPYALKIGDPIRFKILFDGKPIFGARIKVWNRFDNRTTIQNIYTQQDGTIETRVSSPGPWLVSVLRMVPSKQPGADWQSYRASLVFGVEK
ncbi:MAG TPA: DUF4198 domain-containing protein [Chryseolinea sp.]|jgi:uncharacterized GH25 family protein|nr:DUF4198 domain-containing protein [Chryseolinea sp.]